MRKLWLYNAVTGAVLLVQGIIMWLISNDNTLPINTMYLQWSEAAGFPQPALQNVGDIQLGPLVASFLVLSGLFLLGSAYVWRKEYESQIKRGMNLFRWIEYSITSSLMIVVIALLCGVYDLSTLILLFALNACMILFGWVMEIHNQTTKKVDWTSYIFGCFAGIVPWIVLALYFFNAIGSNADAVPTFVYFIFWSLFITFNIFGITMVLQYKKIGKWKNYINGEFTYITLSLVAKTLLAWQVFGGTLR
ncbi:hypothetical protein EOM57_04125 [Candidatus Saccharibacteria bacterium]|nr:hypothetical protein [Candidatus Saccharibacteria bacterium]